MNHFNRLLYNFQKEQNSVWIFDQSLPEGFVEANELNFLSAVQL